MLTALISLICVSIFLILPTKVETLLTLPDEFSKDLRSCTKHNHSLTFHSNIVPLNNAKRELILSLHNNYRSSVNPPAANMKQMYWSERLEEVAFTKAATCKWELDETDSDYTTHSLGINKDVALEDSGRDAIMRWWGEKSNYDLIKMICEKGTSCTHFVQLVWAESYSIGCGMARCSVFHYLFICLYFPAGNLYAYRPYSIGEPCTRCLAPKQLSADLCLNNLCVAPELCKYYNLNCICNIKLCHNCGTMMRNYCRCHCKEGWDAPDCSRPCKNDHTYCNKMPGWQGLESCTYQYNRVKDIHCRSMCGQCISVKLTPLGNQCCHSHICVDGKVLSPITCKCVNLCPGLLCNEEEEEDSAGQTPHLEKLLQLNIILFVLLIQ